MRDVDERFLDMIEAIQRIEKYASHGRQAFVSDELIQTYIVHNLQILGEAAAKVPVNQQSQYADLPWLRWLECATFLSTTISTLISTSYGKWWRKNCRH